MPEHAVLIHLQFSSDDLTPIFDLEDQLQAAVEEAGVGDVDGNECAADECVLFLYGPDADQLFEQIAPLLQASPLSMDGYVIKRYGEPGAPEQRVELTSVSNKV